MNCITTSEAKQLIYDCIDDLNNKVIKRLTDWNSIKLAKEIENMLDPWECSSQYLNKLCKDMDISILKPDKLEYLRVMFCNESTIHDFFEKFKLLMNYFEGKYIYNADETGLAAKKTLKILTTDKNLRITIN